MERCGEGEKTKKAPRPTWAEALPEKGYTSPLDFESSIFNKKEPAMFITSQALTGPIAGYCVFSDMKNPLSKFLWTVDHLVRFQGLEPWAR